VQVQAGIYHPVRASIRLTKDDPAQWWALSSTRGPWGKLGAIRVDKGQTVTLRFGPPITLHADLQQNGGVVSLGLGLIGQAGEEWSPSVMTSEGRAAPPGVRIVDESGKVLAEASSSMAEAAYAGTRGECQMDSKANTKSGLTGTWDPLRPGTRTFGIPSREDARPARGAYS